MRGVRVLNARLAGGCALALVITSAVAGVGCAARAPVRPAGAPSPDPGAVQAFAEATRACAGLSSLTVEIGLSGRALGERVRGRLISGLARPASARLEAVAPFGPPVFILVAKDDRGTVYFARERRVLEDTPVKDILERLTGLDLGAGELRLLLTGCLVEGTNATEGRTWPGGWRAVALGERRTAYLRDVGGQPVVVAADYGPWSVDYADHLSGWPRTVRVRRANATDTDVTARLQQLEINVPLEPRAFEIEIPPDTARVTLDDLRSVAPLRDKSPAVEIAKSPDRQITK